MTTLFKIGSILGIIHAMIFLVLFTLFRNAGEFNLLWAFTFVFDFPIYFLQLAFSLENMIVYFFLYTLLGSFFWFIIGTIIGLIINKLKSSKNK